MVDIFSTSTGPVLIDCMDVGATINQEYFINKSLKQAVKAIQKERPRTGVTNMKILFDNARPHVHADVNNFLMEHRMIKIDHPPYSPDLAPCDFWLFDLVKRQLGSHKTTRGLKMQITKILNSIPKEEYLKTFEKYLEQMELCIESEGEYFEHFIK